MPKFVTHQFDFCQIDKERLDAARRKEAEGDGHRPLAWELRGQIGAAYAGILELDSDDLDEVDVDNDDWDAEELEFILADPSDFNRLAHRQRAEYVRVLTGRPRKRREDRGAELEPWNIIPAGRGRRKTEKTQ